MRRPTTAAQPRGVLVVIPHDRSGDLPVWRPDRPAAGWTPTAVVESALEYADLNAEHPGDHRRLARAAYRAIMVALPDVKQAEIVARLRGEHVGFAALDAAQLDAPDDLGDDPDDDAPF